MCKHKHILYAVGKHGGVYLNYFRAVQTVVVGGGGVAVSGRDW